MARMGRPAAAVELTEEERQTLARWSRRAKPSQALAQRCRIVLGCAEGKSDQQVAAELGIWPQTVGKWRRRFLERRLEGLADEPRPGAPRKITDEQIEQVVVATLERTPAGATHWSRSSMAAESGLSKSTVGRIWTECSLPHSSYSRNQPGPWQRTPSTHGMQARWPTPENCSAARCTQPATSATCKDRAGIHRHNGSQSAVGWRDRTSPSRAQ
jgi:transposase